MSQGAPKGSRVLRRQERRRTRRLRKWCRSRIRALVITAVAVVVIAAVVVTALLVDRNRNDARRAAAAAAAATSTTGFTSPYDLTELPVGADLDVIGGASFASLSIMSADGKLTSYGVDSTIPAMQALTKAILDAEEVSGGVAATAAGGDGSVATARSTITFVLPSRETLTFALDLDRGLISRQARVWRPDGELKALVEAATARP